MPGGRDLKSDVIDTSLCTLCGACLDWCPYIKNLEDNLVVTFDCNVNEGRCYSVCPRTYTNWQQVNDTFLANAQWSKEIGNYIKIYRVKSLTSIPGQQDGGTVSSLMTAALEHKAAEALLLTGTSESIIPEAFIGYEPNDIKKAAGSKFLASPGLRKVLQASEKGIRKLLIVGRPCQIQAVRKMQINQTEHLNNMDIVSIGLFCMWSLSWDFLTYLQNEYSGQDILSLAIPRHGVQVMTSNGVNSIATDKVREFIRPGCHFCLDMTSELADLSVGAFEAEDGWNSLIVRSATGITLLRQAVEQGLLEVDEYPESELQLLKQASVNKKLRNLAILQALIDQGKVKAPIDFSKYEHLKEVNS